MAGFWARLSNLQVLGLADLFGLLTFRSLALNWSPTPPRRDFRSCRGLEIGGRPLVELRPRNLWITDGKRIYGPLIEFPNGYHDQEKEARATSGARCRT